VLNHGEQVEPSLVFQELVDQVLQDLVKPLSVIWSEKVECSPPLRHGEDGTEELTSSKRDMQLLPQLLPPELYL